MTTQTKDHTFSPEQVSLFWDTLAFFFKGRNAVLERYKAFQSKGEVVFEGFDELIVDLDRAKDGSHELFRDSDQQDFDDPGVLFDFVLSTIYHETLHIKEYVYILQAYSAQYDQTASDGKVAKLDSLRQWVGQYTSEIFNHARRELPDSFLNVSNLFESCEIILGHLLPLFGNTNLGRIAYCSRASTVREMFGPMGIVKIFDMMYKGGAAEGFATVGLTLVKNGFLREGAKALKHMVRLVTQEAQPKAPERIFRLANQARRSVDASAMSIRTKNKLIGELDHMVAIHEQAKEAKKKGT